MIVFPVQEVINALLHPESDDDLVHWICCWDDATTLCGFHMPDGAPADTDDQDCIVCGELIDEDLCPIKNRHCRIFWDEV